MSRSHRKRKIASKEWNITYPRNQIPRSEMTLRFHCIMARRTQKLRRETKKHIRDVGSRVLEGKLLREQFRTLPVKEVIRRTSIMRWWKWQL